MEKTLDLKMPGVMELGREELREMEGGSIASVLKSFGKKITPIAIGIWVFENWSDIKEGVVDGWNENH
jgi:hypothetical protein